MKIKLIKKADIFIILFLVAVCAVMLVPGLFSDGEKTANIYKNGELIRTVNLTDVEKDYEIELDGAVILVEKNAVSFKEADCPDKLCVKCGKLRNSGDTAVCVPTRTVITVTDSQKGETDAISY